MKRTAVILVLSVFLLGACTLKQEKNVQRTISVTGTGIVELSNDKAVIALSVVTRNNDILQASEENARRMEAVQKAMETMGISRDNIVTSNFYINQESSRVNGRTVLGQYTVSNDINIIDLSISKTGQIIDEAIKAGANKFNSISFSTGKTDDAEKQARILALRDAEQKALTLAATSGCSLGKIISINETQAYSGISKNAVLLSASEDTVHTPVSGGKTSVTVNVEAVYEIE